MSKEVRPLIGISCGILSQPLFGTRRHNVGETYVNALVKAGAAPIIIPDVAEESVLFSIYRSLDGLLLSGGEDIDPRHYDEPMSGTEDIDDTRDAAELTIAKWALEDDMPLFGICRGHQVLNVALGGSLYQDISGQLETNIDHRAGTHSKNRTLLSHGVEIEPESRLATIVGTTGLEVNSMHHQSVKGLGRGLKATAKAPDGVNEALESSEHTWVLSVQWHPEDLYNGQIWSQKLFGAFVSEVRGRK